MVEPQWMAVEAQGDHIEFYCCSYSIPKDGSLTITSIQNGTIVYIARKTGEDIGYLIGYQGSGNKHWRGQLTKYLEDDSSLCEKNKNKEIEPSDLQMIADLYNPNKK